MVSINIYFSTKYSSKISKNNKIIVNLEDATNNLEFIKILKKETLKRLCDLIN